MIEIHWFGALSICFMSVLFGVVIGTKTSAHRWIEYKEWQEWKSKNDS